MSEGYIYILLNRAFQNDHYKIGMTTKAPEDRAREISSATGVPRAFEVLYEQRVIDCQRAERLLHQRLHQYRSASNREFFQIPFKAAIRALESVADEIGRVESGEEATPQLANHAVPPPAQLGEISVGSSRPPRKDRSPKATSRIVTFEDHLAYTTASLQPALKELRNRTLALDDRLRQEEQCTAGQRIAYKRPGSKIFLEVKVQRAAIVLHLADGGCPDTAGLTEDIPESHGWRQLKKRIVIVGMEGLDAAMPFVECAYRAHL